MDGRDEDGKRTYGRWERDARVSLRLREIEEGRQCLEQGGKVCSMCGGMCDGMKCMEARPATHGWTRDASVPLLHS